MNKCVAELIRKVAHDPGVRAQQRARDIARLKLKPNATDQEIEHELKLERHRQAHA